MEVLLKLRSMYLGIVICVGVYLLVTQLIREGAIMLRLKKLSQLSTKKINALTELEKVSSKHVEDE